MSTVQPRAPLTRVFVGLWDGMNFIRRLTLNLLFFGFLLLIALVVLVAMFGRGSRPAPLLERTTLVIAPEGALVEQYRTDPLMRALAESGGGGVGEVQLRDVLRALEAAKTDTRIERVLLRTDRMTFSGYASMREVADAIAEVRAAGKQVVAFGEYFGQQQYLLAAQADEVYLDPEGGMLLEGLSGYRQYYREALEDKLGVDMHLFKVGEYKSAAEPYILDGASPEAKEADLYWMNDIWQRHIADIAKVRGTTPEALNAGVATLPQGIAAAQGDLAQYALAQKFVDGLKTREALRGSRASCPRKDTSQLLSPWRSPAHDLVAIRRCACPSRSCCSRIAWASATGATWRWASRSPRPFWCSRGLSFGWR